MGVKIEELSIKAARVERGFTQEALAEKLGVTRKTVISWENGDVDIKPYVIYSLAYVLEMNADQIRVPIRD